MIKDVKTADGEPSGAHFFSGATVHLVINPHESYPREYRQFTIALYLGWSFTWWAVGCVCHLSHILTCRKFNPKLYRCQGVLGR
jgi:hypothetical protein